MGSAVHTFAELFKDQVRAENQCAAAQIMDFHGRTVSELMDSFNLEQSLQSSKKGGKPKMGFKGPPPILLPTKASFGPYDPSLSHVQGLGKENHCHHRIGGAADHHLTHWGSASVPSTPIPPSRAGSQVDLQIPPSRAGSQVDLQMLPESRAGRSTALSRRSKSSKALSAASSVLLTQKVEEAVRKEISRLTTPVSKTSG